MGSSSNEFNSLIVWNMKYLALLAIALFAVVAAEPEADADAAAHYYGGYYGYPGYGYRYGGYYGYPGYGYGGYYRHFGKRSADAEPEADADAYFYGAYPYGLGYYGRGYYGYPGYAYGAVASSSQHVSTPAATYGITQLHKRSADAEPEADADADAYYYGAYGHRYGLGYYGHRYGGYYATPMPMVTAVKLNYEKNGDRSNQEFWIRYHPTKIVK